MREPNSNCGVSSIFESKVGHSAYIHIYTKSLYRSRARRHFYGTENVIWAGFGPIGSTENGPIFKLLLLLRAVFDAFISHFFKYCCTKKLSNVRKPEIFTLKTHIQLLVALIIENLDIPNRGTYI